MSGRPAHLALADGTLFSGRAFGADTSVVGEVVFTTGMTGYQEVLTDPSYCGQIVTMTAPQIGNTGINARRHGIAAIADIDTRRLTRHLRDRGAQNGAIGSEAPDVLVERARSAPSMEGLDLVQRVTPAAAYDFREPRGVWSTPFGDSPRAPSRPLSVVAMDFGAKRNILRCLVDAGCNVKAVPASTSAKDILALNPDGVFLSNGPGDPAAVTYAVATIRELLGKKPIFGICLGHQLLALALGAKTYKLKFGHRGLNQPVQDLATGRVEITTQNHGFCVDVPSIAGVAKSTHLHLNDGTSEGLEAPDARAFSVQYHPEAAAGPHDALYLFDRFVRSMAT
jgi:carbamoyl-phosphate synthase small subunit